MKSSLQLGTYAGIKVQIHWTFWLLIVWIVLRELFMGNSVESMLWSSAFIGLLFLCVVFHEYGHALTARRFGINTEKITLLPIGGVASLEDMPEDPKQEFLVAIAGPLVNVAIALLLYPLVPLENYVNQSPEELQQTLSTIQASNLLFYLFSANVMLVLFNLLPAFPMDGGRVLRALLSMKMNRVMATKIASGVGQFLAMIFFFIGIFYNPILLLIAIFVFFGAQAESSMIKNIDLLQGYKVKDAMMTDITMVSPDDTLQDMVDIIISGAEKNFVVAEDDRLRGVLFQDELIRSIQNYKRDTPVREVMSEDYGTVQAGEDLNSIFRKIRRHKRSFFPVLDGEKVVGSIDMENINEFITIQAMPDY
ncbi:MAG: site-2 protease family protein [Candidatus Halalkalibacterium sp. M3_1C_030]